MLSNHTQLREIESSRKAKERELEETNFRLQEKHQSLRQQSKKLEETLLNDTDHRLAAVRSMCASMKSEVGAGRGCGWEIVTWACEIARAGSCRAGTYPPLVS